MLGYFRGTDTNDIWRGSQIISVTTITLGLDGGCFELIEPWLQAGDLPNINRIIEEGAAGDMQSCLPPVTCPNWKCYATGTNPGKLGVFWWETVDRQESKIQNASSAVNFDGKPFWDELDGKVAILNLPTSYPPPSVDGIHIAGGPGAEQTGFTEPSELEAKLKQKYNHQVHPEMISLLSKDNPESPCIEEIYEMVDQRFDLLLDELSSGEYEFIHLTVFYLNVLQHFHWDHEIVKMLWQRIDTRVGEILKSENLEHLFVMSDHGSNEIKTEFHINTWLEQEGYLVTADSGIDWLSRLGITRERIRPLLGKLGVEWWLRRFVPNSVQDMLPSEDGQIKKSGKSKVIDWEQSTAIASGQGPVYVLSADPDERKEIREELLQRLDRLTDNKGDLVVREALVAADIYEGSHVTTGPDLILRQAPNVHIDGSIGSQETFEDPKTWSGENKETGFFMAYGAGLATDTFPEDMHILDIAPTILHLHGHTIPEVLDGAVRSSLFKSGTEAAERDPMWTEQQPQKDKKREADETRVVSDRLEDLGYL